MFNKNILKIFLFAALISALAINGAYAESVTAEVLSLDNIPSDTGTARITLRILDGKSTGDTLIYTQHLWGHSHYDPQFEVGKQFTAQILRSESGEFNRLNLHQERKDWKLVILFVIVSIVLFLVGRWEGLLGLVSTGITVGLIYGLFFPWVEIPDTIIPLGTFVCLATIVITVILIMRGSKPTIPAIGALIAVFGLITIATVIGFDYLKLNASQARHSRLIISWLNNPGALKNLLIFGIVIGTLGALMDVAVVISSSIHEIVRDAPEIAWTEAYRSGIRIGREILSTMVNTLVFAYMGILLPILLGFRIFDLSWLQFLHFDFVGIEILRISIGLMGLSLIIPVTSLFSAVWFRRNRP